MAIADGIPKDFRFFQVKDKSFLKYESEVGNGLDVERIIQIAADGTQSEIWRFEQPGPLEKGYSRPLRVVAGRQFGDVFGIILEDAMAGHREYIRVDASKTPRSWMAVWLPWRESPLGENPLEVVPPKMMIENPFRITFQTRDGKEVVLYLSADGRFERNGVEYQTVVLENGRQIERKVQEPPDTKQNQPEQQAATKGGLVKESASGTSTTQSGAPGTLATQTPLNAEDHGKPATGRIPLYVIIIALLTAAFGWLAFRAARKGRNPADKWPSDRR